MAQFDRTVTVTMIITQDDKAWLTFGEYVLAEIKNKMDEENADYLEHINTGELIDVDDIKKALWTINSLTEDKFGKEWKFV